MPTNPRVDRVERVPLFARLQSQGAAAFVAELGALGVAMMLLLTSAVLVTGARAADTTDALSTYRLNSGDVISIRVFGEDDFTREKVRLTDAGTVSFPILGEVPMLGRTVGEIETLVTERLKGRYLVNPRVSVWIDEYRSFFVNGMHGNRYMRMKVEACLRNFVIAFQSVCDKKRVRAELPSPPMNDAAGQTPISIMNARTYGVRFQLFYWSCPPHNPNSVDRVRQRLSRLFMDRSLRSKPVVPIEISIGSDRTHMPGVRETRRQTPSTRRADSHFHPAPNFCQAGSAEDRPAH